MNSINEAIVEQGRSVPVIQRVVSILWPSFITAGIATALFFTAFDPQVVFVDYDISRLGAYSIGFFLFWLFGIATAMLTCFFMRPCSVTNQRKNTSSTRT